MGVGTRDGTRRDQQGAAVRSAAPGLLSGEAPPRRMTVKSVCLAGTLPTAWSWAIRTTAAHLKAPPGAVLLLGDGISPNSSTGFLSKVNASLSGPRGAPQSQPTQEVCSRGRPLAPVLFGGPAAPIPGPLEPLCPRTGAGEAGARTPEAAGTQPHSHYNLLPAPGPPSNPPGPQSTDF